MSTLMVLLAVGGIALVVILLSVKHLVVICQPSEVVIFSGPQKREGARVGYKAVRGGRGLRIPLLEVGAGEDARGCARGAGSQFE